VVVPDDVPAEGNENADGTPPTKSTAKTAADPSARRAANETSGAPRRLLDTLVPLS
jgi:hypothetical protein